MSNRIEMIYDTFYKETQNKICCE